MAYDWGLSSLIHCDVSHVDQLELLGHYCSNATLTATWRISYITDQGWWHSEQKSCQFCAQITWFKNCYTTDTVVLDVVVSYSTKQVLWCTIIVTSRKCVIGGVILFPISCSFRQKVVNICVLHLYLKIKNSMFSCLEGCYEQNMNYKSSNHLRKWEDSKYKIAYYKK